MRPSQKVKILQPLKETAGLSKNNMERNVKAKREIDRTSKQEPL